jgi:predicted permease
MLSLLIQYSIAAACLLFVVSLPIAKLQVASTMRRIACALFLLAFLPSLFFGIIAAPHHHKGGAAPSSPTSTLALIGGFVVLSLIAYVILAIRKRLKKSPKDAWSEYVGLRSSGKRPVGTDPRTSHTSSLFEEEP